MFLRTVYPHPRSMARPLFPFRHFAAVAVKRWKSRRVLSACAPQKRQGAPLCVCAWVSRWLRCNRQRSAVLHAPRKNGYCAMTHPNLQTNGASLEDCHTNFFALVCSARVIGVRGCVWFGGGAAEKFTGVCDYDDDVFFMWTNAPATLPDVTA